MPRYDRYHNQVKNALIKDGWTITHNQFLIKSDGLRLFADLGAERIVEEGNRKIVVEVKVFGDKLVMNDFEKAVGQYLFYRFAISKLHPERKLYLAVSEDAHEELFREGMIREFLINQQFTMLVFNADKEEVVTWIN